MYQYNVIAKTNGELLADLYCRDNRQMPWWFAEEIIAINNSREFETWYSAKFTGVQKTWDHCLTLPICDDAKSIQDSKMAYKFVEVFENELYPIYS